MAYEIKRLSQLKDALGFMVLCAGTSFPKVGPFGDDQGENLEVGFDRLRAGLVLAKKRIKDPHTYEQVQNVLELSLAAYRSGDRSHGSHLLQNIEDIIFPNRFKEYEDRKGVGSDPDPT